VHAEPRFTRDVDVVVACGSEEDVDRVIFALHAMCYSVRTVLEHTPTGRLSTVRLVPPGSVPSLLVDLLFASSGIEDVITAGAEMHELVPGLKLPVARAGHLAAMKALAFDPETRPQDLSDLRAILERCDQSEFAVALDAAKLITERGFHRDKCLEDLLRRAMPSGSATP